MAAKMRAPGLIRAGEFTVLGVLFAFVLITIIRLAYGFSNPFDGVDGWDEEFQNAVLTVGLIASPLFFLVGLGAFDYWFYWAAGKPTRPEDHSSHGATLVEGLLPREHRPQGDRHPVRRHLVLLHAGRRPAGDAGARGARRAGLAVRRRQRLQRALQRPRVADDLPVHHPRVRGPGELRAAADDRRAGHGVPAPERAVVLDAAAGRPDDDRVVPRPRRLVRHRLDGLRAALDRCADRPALLHDRRAVRGRVIDRHGAELPRDDHHHACARHELLAHAAAGVGELLDLAAGRHRHPVRRRLAVLRPARLRAATSTSSTGRRAATC